MERENRELKRAYEILRKASVFGRGGARLPSNVMVPFIDEHRVEYWVETICAELPIAPSTHYEADGVGEGN